MKVRTITRTAVLLSLTVVFQTVGRLALAPAVNNYLVGPLVNACLLVAAAFAGLFPALLISILAPVSAVLTGASIPIAFVPFIGVGNMILVTGYFIFIRIGKLRNNKIRVSRIAGIIAGAVAKTAFLAATIRLTIVLGWLGDIPPKKEAALTATFSLPQLLTALIGGVVAIAVIEAISKIHSDEQ